MYLVVYVNVYRNKFKASNLGSGIGVNKKNSSTKIEKAFKSKLGALIYMPC
jgi:hypothetical protein